MKIPVEKSIYRKAYLQLRTGFLSERPLFYDAVRLNPPPVFTRSSDKLPNLVGLEDRLMKNFQRKYPYHFEDFVSDNPESTRYVAYNFAKKQAELMKQGKHEKEAFAIVEKEFLSEFDGLNDRIFSNKNKSSSDKATLQQQFENPDLALHDSLKKQLNRQQRQKIHFVINQTIENYKTTYGDSIIAEKLASLEHYRLDKAKPVDSNSPVSTDLGQGEMTTDSKEDK